MAKKTRETKPKSQNKTTKKTTQNNQATLKKDKKNKNMRIPKTAQETIPYESVYANGVIEVRPGVYSKSYLINNLNFKNALDDEQESMFEAYGTLLNSFSSDMTIQLTLYNRTVDENKIINNILIKPQSDNLNEYRDEINDILRDKMTEGRNNLMQEIYITVSLESNHIEDAFNVFKRLDSEIDKCIRQINGDENAEFLSKPISIEDRLAILYEIYNPYSNISFERKVQENGVSSTNFDLKQLLRAGLTSKDAIAPEGIMFASDYFMIGNKYAKSLFLDNLPTFLTSDILTELADQPCGALTSVYFQPIPMDKAIKLVKNQLVNINSNVIDAQKKAAKAGYSPDLISPELMKAQEEADLLLNDIMSRNQKIFLVSLCMTLFADSLEELNQNAQSLQTIANRYLCQIKCFRYQQEPGFNSSLPLANNYTYVNRLMTTESASIFIPFSTQEINHVNGLYYGLNATSKNLVRINRKALDNANGVILGKPGSGKSMTAKLEMILTLLSTDDDVFVIDPEREYAPLAKLFGGEIIKISPNSKTFINPLDMDINYANEDDNNSNDDGDPVALKCDYLVGLCEMAMGGKYAMNPAQKSIIGRCATLLYGPYLKHMESIKGSGVTCDYAAAPTLEDFYELLLNQPEMEAQEIALSLEIYCSGPLDVFAHKTNVDTKARFVIYDIKDIGSGMKELGLHICLNDIWNRTISNKIKRNVSTRFYIDEFYLLTQTPSSAKFLQEIYKRARKWKGIPTGITQNVEDLLISQEAKSIINNSNFIVMLNQSPFDREQLSAMFNISPAEQQYITNSQPGSGLIYTGQTLIPFENEFPQDSKLFAAMTTKS